MTKNLSNAQLDCRLVTTTFEHTKNPTPINVRDWTWGEFVDFIENQGHTRCADKEQQALFGFFSLRDGTTRSKKNVDQVFGWALDLDKLSEAEVSAVAERLVADGLAFLVYSTHSHSEKQTKLRVVGPLLEPVAAKDWPPVWRALVDRYSPGADEQCKDCSRIFHWPSCPEGVEPILFSEPGKPLDVSTLDVKPAPADGPRVDLDAREIVDGGFRVPRCPIDRAPVEHGAELCRTMPAAVEGQGGSVALLRVARALAWGLELSDAQTLSLLSTHYNPRCAPPWSDAEIEHKVTDASGEAGAPYAKGHLLVRASSGVDDADALSDDTRDAMAAQRHTDAGNAERFALMHRDRLRYCTPRKRWLLWCGNRWNWDEKDRVFELAKHTARAMWDEIGQFEPDSAERKRAAKNAMYAESRQGLTNMLALAQPILPVLPTELDADPWSFNVQNGTIDLRTGEMRAHSRDELITKISPVDYDPGAASALWDDCLKKFTGGDVELAGYLQRAVGYALIGSVNEKAFWFGFGPPNGGKSTFISAVTRPFGDYSVATDADTWLRRRDVGGNRGDVVRLLGARLVTCVEFQKGARFDEKLIKGVTGGDAMTAAAKYESDVTFFPQFALWFAANDAPTIHDDDEGMWSRVRRVPFTVSIPASEQDRTVRDRIREPEHARAVLAWAVAGCLRWQKDGLGACRAIEQSNVAYRREMDRCAPFFDERCEFLPEHETSSTVLRQRYEDWCRDRRVRPVSPKELAAKLRDRGCHSHKASSMRWTGVALREPMGA